MTYNYNFDEIVNRKGTNSYRWDARQALIDRGMAARYDDDTIPLFVADMDIACSPQIVEALHKTADHRIFGYSLIPNEYYDALIGWFKRRHSWKVARDEIVFTCGTVDSMYIAVRAFTEPGDGVIIQQPVYPAFANSVRDNGRTLLNNAVINNDGYYTIDFDDFEAKAKLPTTKLFFLCSPHNPTGRVFSIEELVKLSDICKANGVILVSDEVHGDIIRCDKTFYPTASVVDDSSHIITCTGLNKTFNTAGLHCSNIIIKDEKLRKKYLKERGHQSPTPFAMAALIAAYNESEQWLDELKVYFDETLDYIDGFLKSRMPKVKMMVPEGTFIVWMDFRGYGLSDEEVHRRIYSDANVILQDGYWFGEGVSGFQRMCIPSPRPVIKEAFERIAKAFEDVE